ELVKLINSAYRGEHSTKGWTTEAHLLDGLRTDEESLGDMMNKKEAVLLKFCDENIILQGCVYLERTGNKMYLGMLTVSPLEQTKGIGKQLLRAAEKYTGDENCTVVRMTVISVRKELINWYEKRGYHKTGEMVPFPPNDKLALPNQPLEFVVMEKEVRNA
ncbi:MAG: GNAT family N-acetyltransferase, partial [Ginsengibacter sp.]